MSKVSVVIGSYQPLDYEQAEVLERAHNNSEHVIVLVGSCNRSASFMSPFDFEARKEMVLSYMKSVGRDHSLTIKPINDHLYNDSHWLHEVHNTIDSVLENLGVQDATVTLFALDRNESTYYIDKFPQFKINKIKTNKKSAYDVVEELYEKGAGNIDQARLNSRVPATTQDFLRKWSASADYEHFKKEYLFVTDYRKQWEGAPYQPIFFTTDAVVYYKGHVLLVRRHAQPGYGMYALPGGFIDPAKKVSESTITNLKKDTKIKVGENILKSNVVARKMFDDPERSTRGRIVTEASLIVLDNITSLSTFPDVRNIKAGQEYAVWFPVNRLDKIAPQLFEDHYFIIKTMLNSAAF